MDGWIVGGTVWNVWLDGWLAWNGWMDGMGVWMTEVYGWIALLAHYMDVVDVLDVWMAWNGMDWMDVWM